TRCLSDWSSDVCSSDLRSESTEGICVTRRNTREGKNGLDRLETCLGRVRRRDARRERRRVPHGGAELVHAWSGVRAPDHGRCARSEERRVGKELSCGWG